MPIAFNIIRPSFRSRPEAVKGTPIFLEIFPFRPDIPSARFHENENPKFFPIFPS